MTQHHPDHYVPPFTEERLRVVAQALLAQCYSTEDDLQSLFDSNFSRGCTRFDRQKNSLKLLSLAYPWLTIVNGGNALVMAVEGAPFRFTKDSYLSPKKSASTSISEVEAIQLQKYSEQCQFPLDFEDKKTDSHPEKWRFFVEVVENPEDETRDYNISFIGLNGMNQAVCVWHLGNSSQLHSVDGENQPNEPMAVEHEPATADVPVITEETLLNDDK